MMMIDSEQFSTPYRAARKYRLPYYSIMMGVVRGDIRTLRLDGGRVLVRIEDVARLAEKRARSQRAPQPAA